MARTDLSAFALLEHADEDGYVQNTDEVRDLVESSKTAKAAKAAAKTKQQASKAGSKAAGNSRTSGTGAGTSRSTTTQHSDTGGKQARAEEYYRAFEHVYKDTTSGEVVLRFHKTNIVRVKPNGDVILNTGGWFTHTTLAAMNDALYAMGLKVAYAGQPAAGSWSVTDDTARVRPYEDEMVIPASRAEHKTGGSWYSVHTQVVRRCQCTRAGAGSRHSAACSSECQACSRSSGGRGQQGRPAAAGASYASAAHAAHQVHQQQQVYAAAAAQHRPAGGSHVCAARKTVHEQLAEAVEQLGLQDELACGDDHLCVVCLEHQRDEVLVPCGHMVLCRFCCQDIMQDSKACPVCREVIVDHCTLEPMRCRVQGMDVALCLDAVGDLMEQSMQDSCWTLFLLVSLRAFAALC
ncbi:hypothetical protein COO60DRAFT_1053840 [Scenedesmus sp. NREL 46B-D3]|nr:hypothetical protein COO60DRAFT_1053840 [Scenedesmus sp. NREL 46B-D3]